MARFLYRILRKETGNFYQGRINISMAHQKTPYYKVRIGHKAAVKLFTYMYKNATIYLERKYKKFIEGINYGT
ncbi:MAG: hypothetical protein A3H50_00290 [Candidatus Levybacteria bacterium RIFCSPLOWO2_02_FULL_37_10]|nr:MAG: hypothetical protein A2860_03790 [Candidatus Levybacteria bacterium RIFCSPHIGHO2_01_FULL_37_33]OGH30114.1 MAG: hypothetical protein A3F30_01835 [Candidatus Levybacteria bacterium RIFCSPHIGHO2_12_FULL_37_12]OGH32366.1 MAG: hypothetical protein A2953_01830 [Candidatus Levybacteria bacterium RIFCSPLOWO2_01_FULL_36_54]OGH46312.1 MAG: hypothetical protein A3H50_00290 [Candidatus Levybacteria bacterium RIFCSPLOWO2_02_FULL_37_10]